jgi:hypothetical protein
MHRRLLDQHEPDAPSLMSGVATPSACTGPPPSCWSSSRAAAYRDPRHRTAAPGTRPAGSDLDTPSARATRSACARGLRSSGACGSRAEASRRNACQRFSEAGRETLCGTRPSARADRGAAGRDRRAEQIRDACQRFSEAGRETLCGTRPRTQADRGAAGRDRRANKHQPVPRHEMPREAGHFGAKGQADTPGSVHAAPLGGRWTAISLGGTSP